jgi:rubrerythrin
MNPRKINANLKIKKKSESKSQLSNFSANSPAGQRALEKLQEKIEKEEKQPENIKIDCVRCTWIGELPKDKKCPHCHLYLGDIEIGF